MIINFNGVKSNPYENLGVEHKAEIFKYFDFSRPEMILEFYNLEFLKKASDPTSEPWAKDKDVLISEHQKVPMLIHFGALTGITSSILPKSETGTPGNTDNICIGSYRSKNTKHWSTVIVPNIILDDTDNTRSYLSMSNSISEFIRLKIIAMLSSKDLDTEQVKNMLLMEYLKIGFVIDVNKGNGYTNLVISYSPTNEVISDRTFTTFD